MRKVLPVAVVAGIWYLAAMYRSGILLGLSMAGIVLMAVFFLWPKIQRFELQAHFQDPVLFLTRQTEGRIPLTVEKKGLLPVAGMKLRLSSLYDGGKKPARHRFVCGCSRGTSVLELPYTPPRCGMLNLRLEKVRIYDPFRLFSSGKKLEADLRIAVFPQAVLGQGISTRKSVSGDERIGDRSIERAGAGSDLKQVRPWVPGDVQRKVHWKLTARMQETMIMEWQDESEDIVTLDLEKEDKNYTQEEADRFYETFCREVISHLQMDAAVRIRWTQTDGVPAERRVSDSEDLKSVLIDLYNSRWLWGGRL